MERRTIALTGCGWVTPVAFGRIPEVLAELAGAATDPLDRGQPGFAAPDGFGSVPDTWRDEIVECPKELGRDRAGWMTALALQIALAEAGLQPDRLDSERTGMVLGQALAGQPGMISFAEEVRGQSARFVSPIHFPQTVGNYLAGAIARGFGFRGPNLTVANAAASGLTAMVEAGHLLASSEADVMVAGGTEVFTAALARAYRDKGKTAADSCCLFVMEPEARATERGANILALLAADQKNAEKALATAQIVSTAGVFFSGGVDLEYWTGFAGGASGAAACAGAIGSAGGAQVPISPDNVDGNASAGTLSFSDGPQPLSVVVAAEGDNGTTVTLSLKVAG